MQVILAGYNLDSEVIESLKKGEKPQDNVTPEVLSASYARISRDPRPINELRESARQEVGKARKSNKAIIFKMGHHSVAEHAVFNFDIIDISRFCMEELEKFRLCAYTEKSQRYQKLENNYILPNEIQDSEAFTKTIDLQNKTYQKMVKKGIEPEDARYITSLATKGQLGLTVNARNLELMFRRFSSSKYAEVRELGREMYKQVEKIAPSIILFTQPNPLDQNTYDEIKEVVPRNREVHSQVPALEEVRLAHHTQNADEITIAALLHTTSTLSFEECRKKAKQMTNDEKLTVIKTALKNMEFFDTTLREFEYVDLTFEITLSAACFGQLKRHRMATLTCQEYDPIHGITIPPKIKEAGMELEFTKTIEATEEAYKKLNNHYVLTNAHRKRVLFKCNARELYHISRLREDAHAQWDIQNISQKMTTIARDVMPLTMLTICGKDVYNEVYSKVFGKAPKDLLF